jgi:hypothetical protein
MSKYTDEYGDLDNQVAISVHAKSHPHEVWMSKGKLHLIERMDFQHLENIVNLFSQEGMVVDPLMQASFENVMLTYLRKQAQINDVHKEIL